MLIAFLNLDNLERKLKETLKLLWGYNNILPEKKPEQLRFEHFGAINKN